MNKEQFLNDLRNRISILPKEEINKSISYYDEAIEDRKEEGMSEEEAVNALGSINEITYNILDDIPMTTVVNAKVKQSKNNSSNKGLWFVIAIITCPIWISLIIAFFMVLVGLIIALFAILASFAALIVAGFMCLVAGCIAGFTEGLAMALIELGIGFALIGVGMLFSKPLLNFVKWVIEKMKNGFNRIKYWLIGNKEVTDDEKAI